MSHFHRSVPCAAAVIVGLAVNTFAAFTSLTISNRSDYAFDSQGVLYITAGSQILRYSTATSSFLSPWNVGGSLVGIDLSPDGGTLAVADSTSSVSRIFLVNRATGQATPVNFTPAFAEAGTFMVAWGADNRVLTTSNFAGSGWIPLRRYDPATNTSTVLRQVRQNTMLTPSGDRQTIGLVESNISSGPVHAYDVATGSIGASVNDGWFNFEVAVSRHGNRLVVPTYDGAFVYDRSGSSLTQQAILGQYASYGPVGAVFSPVADYLFTAEYDWNGTRGGVKVYNANSLALLGTIDPYNFGWQGNGSMGNGRIEISPDGRWLVASVTGGARLYDVSAYYVPATPGPPTVNGATASSLNVANNAGDSGTAYFAIRISGGSYTNQYVQANGSVGASAVWQTKATWSTKTVTGLAASTTYTFDLAAANDASGTSPSGFGTSAQGTTLCQPPPTPGAPTVNGATASSLNLANNASDSSTAYFAIRINGGSYTNQYVQADGSVGASAVWQTKATWGTKTVTGLAASTTYTFDFVAANDASGTCPTDFAASAQGTTEPATIVIADCDTGVANQTLPDGATMANKIAKAAADGKNHGQFVSAVALLTNEWKKDGLITGAEKGRIQACAATRN